jgi:hypothetical protein
VIHAYAVRSGAYRRFKHTWVVIMMLLIQYMCILIDRKPIGLSVMSADVDQSITVKYVGQVENVNCRDISNNTTLRRTSQRLKKTP